MGPLGAVVLDPFGDRGAGMGQAVKQGLVQKLIAHASVEALDEGVLHRLARRDVMPVDAMLRRPGEDGVRCELGSVVGDDHAGRGSATLDDAAQLPRHATARDRHVRNGAEALAGDVVDDDENAEVNRPGFVGGSKP